MNENFGFAHFWEQGDTLSHGVVIVLLLMSVTSWTIILRKALGHVKVSLVMEQGIANFWKCTSQTDAIEAMRVDTALHAFAQVAADAHAAHDALERVAPAAQGRSVDVGEFMGRAIQQSMGLAQARLERGLTFLASVGATAPFVGLLGTVWGIYHALIGLSGSSHVVLDRVAGPVGEALIMTAAGLFVAIPSVLAYNTFVRVNRNFLARLDGFANALHAFHTAGVKPPGSRDGAAGNAKLRELRTEKG